MAVTPLQPRRRKLRLFWTLPDRRTHVTTWPDAVSAPFSSRERFLLAVTHLRHPDQKMQTAPTKLKLVKPKGRILVIEDNRDAADSLKIILEGFGYETDVAYGGEEGLQAALDSRPDLILSDIGLPDLDGFELVRRLRRSEITRDIPILALTAYGPEARDMAFASGFNGHLVKPVEPQLMRSILAGYDLESQ